MNRQPEYLTTEMLATMTHSRPQTWRRRRCDGDSPPYIKLGNRILYRRADVEAWFAARTVDQHANKPDSEKPSSSESPGSPGPTTGT